MARYKYDIEADNLCELAHRLDIKIYTIRRYYKEANSSKQFKDLIKKHKLKTQRIGKILESVSIKYNIPLYTLRTIYYVKCDKDMNQFKYELSIKIRYDKVKKKINEWYTKYKNLTETAVNRIVYTRFFYTKHDLIDDNKFKEVEMYIAERYQLNI